MGMSQIREAYSVPAKRGALIRYTQDNGESYEGKIVGAQGMRLRVRLFDSPSLRDILTMHPTWNIEYLKEES